jgi:uncharacterized phiE125 gp8 family phage protein
MPLQIVSQPSALPLDISEARLHVRQDTTDDDLILESLIYAATDYAEGMTSRQIIAARYTQILDSFPGPTMIGVPWGKSYGTPKHAIVLQRSPVLQVVSIQYVDMQGTLQTITQGQNNDFIVSQTDDITRITPPFGRIWPIPMPQIGSVIVTFDVGYAAPIIADSTADTISPKGIWPILSVNQTIILSNSGGALPSPLQPDTYYFIKAIPSTGVYQLSSTVGGSLINLTDNGSGTSYIGKVPRGITAWMKIRLGTLYENREEVAILNRGKLEPLPYVDRLLDQYKIIEF